MTTPFLVSPCRTAALLVVSLLLAIAANTDAEIVFSALQEGTWQIYRQADPRSPPQPILTPGISGDKGAPRLSPDGTRVAFEVTGGGLWVCPVAGTAGCRAIAAGPGSAVRPAWHPRTGDLVYVRFAFKADEEQSTIELAGRDLDQIRHRTGHYEVWTVGADGTGLHQTTEGPGEKTWPTWSPDGTHILFTHTREGRTGLSLVNAGGGTGEPIAPFGTDAQVQIKDPDWVASPHP